MKTKLFVCAGILILAFLLWGSKANGQIANYKGKEYTPENFPKAKTCSCDMCQSIRDQWENAEYRIEMRTEEYQVKVCSGIGLFKTCRYETRTRQVPVKIKINKEQQKSIETPDAAIAELFKLLQPDANDIVIDAGCGTGKVLVEASKFCLAIGVELDPQQVSEARKRIAENQAKAIVFHGDAAKFDYSEASIVYIYQYPDLLKDIVARIPAGVKVVSFSHDIPGVSTRKHTIQASGKTHEFYIGVVGEVAASNSLTFGL